MALSERHAIFGTVAVCALIASAKLPPTSAAPPRDDSAAEQTLRPVTPGSAPEARAREDARGHLREATNMLVLLERRDSALVRLTSRTGERGAPVVLFGAGVPDVLRAMVRAEIAREITGVGRQLDALPVAVSVVLDTATPAGLRAHYTPASWLQIEYVLPPATDGRTCLSIVRIGASALRAASQPLGHRQLGRIMAYSVGSFLGPCALYGAHGAPGPAIQRWIADTRFSVGLRAPVRGGADSIRLRFEQPEDDAIERWRTTLGWRVERSYLNPSLVRCAEGDRAQCAATMNAMRTGAPARRSPWLLRATAGPRITAPLGPSQTWLLASLHQEVGAESFGRFWTSALAPEDAWTEATGYPLSDDVQRWVRDTYNARTDGAWPHPFALGGQLVLAVGLVAASALRARRRMG